MCQQHKDCPTGFLTKPFAIVIQHGSQIDEAHAVWICSGCYAEVELVQHGQLEACCMTRDYYPETLCIALLHDELDSKYNANIITTFQLVRT